MADQYKLQVKVETHYLSERSDPTNRHFCIRLHHNHNQSRLGWCAANDETLDRDRWRRECAACKGRRSCRGTASHHAGRALSVHQRTVLETPVGTMEGSYQLTADDGAQIDAEIPKFVLTARTSLH